MTDATSITFTQNEPNAIQTNVAAKLYQDVSVKDFGATGNGTTDDSNAIQTGLTAIQAGGRLFLPAGTYLITKALSFSISSNQGVTIYGAGQDVSILYFSQNSGLAVGFANNYSSVQISDLSFTGGTAGGGGAALFMNQASADYNPANAPLSSIRRVTVRGSDGYAMSHYWQYGFLLEGISNLLIESCAFASSASAGNGTAITVTGGVSSTYAVQINVMGCSFYNGAVGVQYGSYVQGVTFSQCNFNGCQQGIESASGESGVLDQLCVTCCQFTCTQNAIVSNTHITATQLVGNLFGGQPNANGVVLTSGNISVVGNSFASGGNNNNNGIVIIGAALAAIVGNNLSGWTTAVWLQSGSSLVNVQSNIYGANVTNVLNQAPSGSNTVGGGSI